ncbi:helix-turn-helix transcriptional regulator [bacterium]|nr:helix-turn-helix transcriptional regulator [bacterium]
MINDNFYKLLGINIKNKRETLSFTQQDLADKTGISLNHIGKIEVAFSKPSLDCIIKIAEALNITVSELCNFQQDN